MVVTFKPVAGDHEYELPTIPEVPIVADVVVQFKLLSLPASAKGDIVFTLTTTASVAVHPFVPVTVTVYTVVALG
jgi:hypothetical protein